MVINCTPHEVTVAGNVYAPSGVVLRVDAQQQYVRDVDGVPVFCETFGECRVPDRLVEVLADRDPSDTVIIASRVVADATGSVLEVAGRRFPVVFPAQFVRDDAGRIVGASALGVKTNVWDRSATVEVQP